MKITEAHRGVLDLMKKEGGNLTVTRLGLLLGLRLTGLQSGMLYRLLDDLETQRFVQRVTAVSQEAHVMYPDMWGLTEAGRSARGIKA